ncbi:MAG TPA: ATP-binding protein [Chloroflexota bacterium]|nr:ATP-binding protein [Chloroflexota bacterium]
MSPSASDTDLGVAALDSRPFVALLIEDNPGDARLIREMLAELPSRSVEIEHANNLTTGLERIAAGGVDVVLLDLSLPEAQGLDTFHRARAAAPELPVIVLTGLADESLAIRAVHEGAQDYLFKGDVRGDLLFRSIRYAIERKRLLESERLARAEAEAGRARVRAILDSAPYGILFFDSQDGHITTNPEAVRLLGRPIEPYGGRAQLLGIVCRPDGHPWAEHELFASRALAGETVAQEEELLRRPDGREIPVLGSARPVVDGDGEVRGAVVILQDISRLKDLERMREEWTSAVAHDLRQPVAAITAFANLLEMFAEQAAPNPQEKAALSHILASSRQLYRMIGDVLDVSRLGAGQLRLERTSVHLDRLVPEVVDRSGDVLEGHPVQMRFEGDLPAVDADPARVEQVLVNLLSNAGKYGEPESEVLVEVHQQDGSVHVAVTNRGVAIPSDELPHLFNRFFRSRAAHVQRMPGLGLGLYVCRELVAAHGGNIWAESAGNATTVRFSLPIAATASTVPERSTVDAGP